MRPFEPPPPTLETPPAATATNPEGPGDGLAVDPGQGLGQGQGPEGPAVQVVPPQEPPAGAKVGQILEPALYMVGVLILFAAGLMIFQALRKRSRGGDRDSLQDQLTQFREAFEKGEMTKEEYRRVHALLTGRIQKQVKAPSPPPPDPAPETGPAT
jgi:hypothetical protein